MIVFFTCMHAGAYFPSMHFRSMGEIWDAGTGQMQHSLNNWKEYHYCACILITFIIIYPAVFFLYLIVDGFDPYSQLTKEDMNFKAKGHGVNLSEFVYMTRVIFHLLLLFGAIYFLSLLSTLFFLRTTSRYPGHHLWFIRRLSKWPYGSLFFQEGEYFDCGICIRGIWR